MSRRLYLFVPGILQKPEGDNDWADVAVRWVDRNTPHVADAYEYRSGALNRFAGQAKRVADVVELLARLPRDMEVTGVGHSNGCDILLRALQERARVRFRSLHLIAAAAERDFDKNGLNRAIADGRLGRLYLYGSRKDGALLAARLTQRRTLRLFGLGYGDLGRRGPTNMDRGVWQFVDCRWENDYGHSTWLDGAHFADTMTLCLR